jgi:predicted PurR-regulated permease PerM
VKRLAGYTAVVIATLGLLVVLWEFRAVVALFVLSLLAASAVRPLIERVVKIGLPLPIAMLLIYIALLGVVVLSLYAIWDSLIAEVQTLANYVAITYETRYPLWLEGSAAQQAIATRLPPPEQIYEALAGQEGGATVRALLGITQGVFAGLGGLALVLVLSIYWSVDRERFERLWLSLLPAAQRARARDIWRSIETGVGAYIRSEAVQAFMAALLLGIGYHILGLDYPTILAILGGIAWLIPVAGFVIIAVPVLVVGLAGDLGLAVAATLYTLAVLLILERVLEPRIFNRRRYSSLLIVLTMITLAQAFGVIGLIVAPPLAAAVQILLGRLFVQRNGQTYANTAAQVTGLEERLATLRARFEKLDEPDAPEIANMMERLDGLLQKASEAFPQEPPPRVVAEMPTAVNHKVSVQE